MIPILLNLIEYLLTAHREGSYVRVMGTLKQISNRKHLTAPTIRLASVKEFLFHKTDVMLVWAKMTLEVCVSWVRGVPVILKKVSQDPSVQPTVGNMTGGDASMYAPGGGQATQQNANYAHLPALDRSILECMQSAPRHDEGVNVNYIATQLSKQGAKAGAAEISYVCFCLLLRELTKPTQKRSRSSDGRRSHIHYHRRLSF